MLWVKAFHIIAVICWFAGLFYLPRLFVYHAMSEDQVSRDRFVIMERKLFWGITTPSAVLTLVLGVVLLMLTPGFLDFWWMRAKLVLVLLVVIYHFQCWRYLVAFRGQQPTPGHKFFRAFNEFPIFLLIGIVILIVVKP